MKFTVTLQKHVVEEYVIEADTAEEAVDIAKKAAYDDDLPQAELISADTDGGSIAVLEILDSEGNEVEDFE